MDCSPRTRAVRSSPSRAAIVVALACLLAPSACASQAKREAAVRALLDREVAAINARDLKALGEIWAQDDSILMFDVQSPGRFQGWERIGRQWRDFFGNVSDLSLKVEMVRVQVEGDIAFATYDWSLTGRMGEYSLDDRGQATAIYRNGEGGWRLVHAHYSAAPPSPEPAADAGAGAGAGATTR